MTPPELPGYVNCNNTEFQDCDYLLTESCPSTCAYAIEIGGIGIGAPVIPMTRQSEKGINDEVD